MRKKILVFILMLILVVALVYLFAPTKVQVIETKEENIESTNEIIVAEEEIEDFNFQIIGTLIIDKIELVAPIKEGSSSEVLEDYVGHIEETAIYDGNVGLAAHNRGNEYSYFARLNELENGDKVIYKTQYGTREYIVDKIEIILETDWTLLANTQKNKITMITCIANRPTQRLCVQASEI